MTESSGDQHRVSIPVDDLEPLSRRLDGVAEDVDASIARLREATSETVLNDADTDFSRSRFNARALSVVDGAKRTTARLRATAALVADTSERAVAADRIGSDQSGADAASPSLSGVVDRLGRYQLNESDGDTGSQPGPDWEQVWDQAARRPQPD